MVVYASKRLPVSFTQSSSSYSARTLWQSSLESGSNICLWFSSDSCCVSL